jgi:hypothetical protein
MININYQKRKNTELFKSLEESTSLFLSDTQNYVPIYKRFFSLNETNFNNINLNHNYYIDSNLKQNPKNLEYTCKIGDIKNETFRDTKVFFKLAPLLDPYKYLIGKYTIDDKLFSLPKLNSSEKDCNPKFIDVNNSAYVDGFFLFLTNSLLLEHNFLHGIEYYGSFLAIKNVYKINVFDDIEYLNNSNYFNKNKNILFQIDEYHHLFKDEKQKLSPIKIDHTVSAKSQLSITSFDNEIFEEIFCDNNTADNFEELKELNIENHDKNVTLNSNSTCSSRFSYTDDDEDEDDDDDEDDEDDDEKDEEDEDEEDDEDDDEDDEDDEEEIINVTIPKFPVEVIFMEKCESTFDDLILNSNLTPDEWYSAFMQIIMILITYQKTFNFTHNDLHTNNIMYNKTTQKYLFYRYKKINYKVPTFGRIYKIIDFGRSIYKCNGNIFCSDSFQNGGDAATQYNTEPYLNEKKPRLEPNPSFDLCRLACSIFDYVVEDLEEIKELSKCEPIKRLIVEWCQDDKGINMLYKNNGSDRYPEFKLYKMIARCVHNHTPQAQLDRPEFKKFSQFEGIISEPIMDIDAIPSYV